MRITNNPIADSVMFRILAISKAIRNGNSLPSKPKGDKVISIGRNSDGVLEAHTTEADGTVSRTVFQKMPDSLPLAGDEIPSPAGAEVAPPFIPTEPEVLEVPSIGVDIPGLDHTSIDITAGLIK